MLLIKLSGDVGFRNQSPSSSEFISNGPAPAGANRGPAANLFVIIYLRSFLFSFFCCCDPKTTTTRLDRISFLNIDFFSSISLFTYEFDLSWIDFLLCYDC